MDEVLIFFIGIAIFLAVITFKWFKNKGSQRTS
jgi:hypothetical protein